MSCGATCHVSRVPGALRVLACYVNPGHGGGRNYARLAELVVHMSLRVVRLGLGRFVGGDSGGIARVGFPTETAF